jgi:hypothetical protein
MFRVAVGVLSAASLDPTSEVPLNPYVLVRIGAVMGGDVATQQQTSPSGAQFFSPAQSLFVSRTLRNTRDPVWALSEQAPSVPLSSSASPPSSNSSSHAGAASALVPIPSITDVYVKVELWSAAAADCGSGGAFADAAAAAAGTPEGFRLVSRETSGGPSAASASGDVFVGEATLGWADAFARAPIGTRAAATLPLRQARGVPAPTVHVWWVVDNVHDGERVLDPSTATGSPHQHRPTAADGGSGRDGATTGIDEPAARRLGAGPKRDSCDDRI